MGAFLAILFLTSIIIFIVYIINLIFKKQPESHISIKNIGFYNFEIDKKFRNKLIPGQKLNTWNRNNTSIVTFFEKGSSGTSGKVGEISNKKLSKLVSDNYIDAEIISIHNNQLKVKLFFR